jgi:hypothetical protein
MIDFDERSLPAKIASAAKVSKDIWRHIEQLTVEAFAQDQQNRGRPGVAAT